MKLSLFVVGVTSIAADWINKNWGEVIKLSVLAIVIITSMQNTLEHNSQQLSTLQLGQLRLTEKVERVQLDVRGNKEHLKGMDKSFERHLLITEKK